MVWGGSSHGEGTQEKEEVVNNVSAIKKSRDHKVPKDFGNLSLVALVRFFTDTLGAKVTFQRPEE